MKIAVCIKQVFDTATKIKLKDDRSGVAEEGAKFILSPYDEFAVEEALRTKEKGLATEVVVFSVGSKRVQETLRSALAMGADRAVHVDTEGAPALDGLGIAKLLARKIKSEDIGLVFTGRQAVDGDGAEVSQMVAEYLGCPHVTLVSKFTLDGGKAVVERDIEGGAKEVWEVTLPAVLAATKGLNEPRYASLKGIMAAKSKPLQSLLWNTLDLPAADLAPKTTWANYTLPAERTAGKIFKDDPAKAVTEVVRLLRAEAKII